MRSDLEKNMQLTDYELPNHDNELIKLSKIQGIDPLILVLAYDFDCPKDQLQHRQLVSFYPELKEKYTKIVTITTDSLEEINRFRHDIGADWTFLSDPQRVVQKDLHIQDYDPQNNFMIPHTIILKPGLIIYKLYKGYKFLKGSSLEDLRRDLRAVNEQIRPSWDITKPDLHDSWLAEKKNKSFPYNNDVS